jgi:hypothetical protein
MHRARQVEGDRQAAPDRGAEQSALRSTPLTIVSGAIAGADLQSVAGSASVALGEPVAIAIPALGEPIVSPEGSIAPAPLSEIAALAGAAIEDADTQIGDGVPVRIGDRIVGVVASIVAPGAESRPDRHAWLQGVAAAAAVTALMREHGEGEPDGSRRGVLRALLTGPPADISTLVAQAQRIGLDLGAGGIAIAVRTAPATLAESYAELLADHPTALLVELGPGRMAGVLAGASSDDADELIAALTDRGLAAGRSSPRRDPADLHEALREAELMAELAASAAGHEETYRLLVGVLLRDPEEVELLRSRTISPLVSYDERHDTDLLATLNTFLAHHGSTSETAEAMGLHRHTVGYRLARVHEVSGLSPYETDGRERLSLGLKAHQILEAELCRSAPPVAG